MDIDKIMNKDISDLSKIMNIDINNLSKFMGLNIPAGGSWIETFTGADGSDPDSTYWNPNQYWEIQNNQLHGSVVAPVSAFVLSKFYLQGDFRIEIDFNDLSTGTGFGSRIELIVGSDDGNETAVIGARYQSGHIFYADTEHNGVWDGGSTIIRTNNYGKLGYSRTENSLSCLYCDGGGGWQTLKTNTVEDNVKVKFYIYASSASCSGDFDNFTVESGTMV